MPDSGAAGDGWMDGVEYLGLDGSSWENERMNVQVETGGRRHLIIIFCWRITLFFFFGLPQIHTYITRHDLHISIEQYTERGNPNGTRTTTANGKTSAPLVVRSTNILAELVYESRRC